MNTTPTSRAEIERPRIGLIGCSGFASVHAELLLEICANREAKLEAVVIQPADRGAEIAGKIRASGARVYENYESFMRAEADRIDLCVIPTGIHWHTRMSIAALESGMNVLVEKPLAGCLADAQLIRAAEKRTGRWVAVAFQDAWTDTICWLGEALQAGKIGRIESIKFMGLWPRTEDYFARNAWAGRVAIDGIEVRDFPFNNAFAHFVHLALLLAAPGKDPASKFEFLGVEKYRTRDIETHDVAVAMGRLDPGLRFWFGGCLAGTREQHPELLIRGSSGRATWQYNRTCMVHPDSGEPLQRKVPFHDAARREMLTKLLQHLKLGQKPLCGTDSATRHVAFVEDFNKSGSIQSLSGLANIDTRLIEAFKKECLLGEVPVDPASSSTSSGSTESTLPPLTSQN